MKITVTYIFSFFLCHGSLFAESLYAILAYDLNARNISDGVMINQIKMERELEYICSVANLDLIKITFPNRFTADQLLSAIKKIKPKENDVIFFFYNGHGYRTESKKQSPWPNISFTGSRYTLDYELILKRLMEKKAGLILALAETCNNFLPEQNGYILITKVAMRPKPQEINQGMYTLFRTQKGGYGMTSSKPGQYSWINTAKGGYFHNAFIKELEKVASVHPNPMWEDVFDTTILETKESLYADVKEAFPGEDLREYCQDAFYLKFK